ncbi:MAG: Mur ligase family protein, partial [Eubacteriales bacterium]|nr:Mur ligase family protein [Eubacteriales bacterium]
TSTRNRIASLLSTSLRVERNHDNLNNPIGIAQTIWDFSAGCDFAVLEMGMDRFGEIETSSRMACPNYAVITNIG